MKNRKGFFTLSGFKLSLIITASLFFFSQAGPNIRFLNELEAKVYDFRFQIRGRKKPPPEIVILVIDEKSIEKIGHWPWPRSILGKGVDILSEAGSALIAFDIIFSEKQVTEAQRVVKELEKKYRGLGLENINTNSMIFYQEMIDAEEGIDHDQKFVSSINNAGNVIIPMYFDFEIEGNTPLSEEKKKILSYMSQQFPMKTFISNPEDKANFPIKKGQKVTLPIPELVTASSGTPHVNMITDTDGAARWGKPFY